MEAQRDPYVDVLSDRDAGKTGSRYADDRKHHLLDSYCLPDNRRISAEAPAPEGVTEDGHGLRVVALIIVGGESATKHGRDAESREKITRHRLHSDEVRFRCARSARNKGACANGAGHAQFGKRGGSRAKLLIE